MASLREPVAPSRIKQLKVLMPPSLHRLGISDELAGCLEAQEALVVSPFGKVWRVEVGRDAKGAFLGRGWAEFLAAHGIGVGWFVVLRHEGGGSLTVKAFDRSFCIHDFGAPAAVMASRGSKEVSCKPQFIRIIHQDSMEKMIIPPKFLKHCISEEYLNTSLAVLISPLGKFWRIEVEKDHSGTFFAGGWPQFLASHGISEGDVLLLRYEGNMVFQLKVFGLNGGQKNTKNRNTGIPQMTDTVKQSESPSSIRKRKGDDERSSREENSRLTSCTESLNKTSAQKQPDYQIGPPSWIKKEMTTHMLEQILSLSVKFCDSIGFRKSCTITLKTAMNSTKSWKVRGLAYTKTCYLLGQSWKNFCKDNKLKKGDICTFNVIEPTLWHVVIMHYTQEQKESPYSSSSREGDRNKRLICEPDNRPKYSISVLSRSSSYTKSVYDIGPPSWIQKQITPNSLKKRLSLARAFCYEIGLRESSTITLKTSVNETRSWQVRGLLPNNNSYHFGYGWKKFYEDNKLKVGDVCTFNIIETTLWHVIITRQ
ncbi:hypothetical protein QOZ80_4BG0358050 [Eleusine coracana subsp. coracana]|nr:hypothetical protein QOZ80_4BG0358050 [Eleusine coracana subsp. coracana]